MTLTLSRDTPIPIVTDYNGELSDPEDPDDLTDLLELEALTVLSDMGTIYSLCSADWGKYMKVRSRLGKPVPSMPDPD